MAALPWWAWLGVGVLIAVLSSIAGGKVAVFAWIGWLFIIFGIAKAVIYFLLRKKETKQEQAQVPPVQHQYYYCPRCRSTVRVGDYFCHRCGVRLR